MPGSILTDAHIATMQPNGEPYGMIARGAIAMVNARIVWCGAECDVPDTYRHWQRESLEGRLVTPALIDCHTHLVFAGNRAREFELLLQGKSYEDIARAGGGIKSTVRATRAASEAELLHLALSRLDHLIAEGVGTVDVKSGYGLTIDDELKMLRVARDLEQHRSIRIRTSLLAAHAMPPDYDGDADTYIDEVCLGALEAAAQAKLADAVDGYCERIAFSPAQIARLFERATALGIPVRLHAEQLSNQRGAELAARYHALSADHLEYLDAHGVQAMAEAGTVAVLLPGAFYHLGETQLPPVALLRAAGVPMAIATDCNPGTSPVSSLLLMLNMACNLFSLTPEEALAGATIHAARALGLADEIGSIAAGKRAEFAVWDVAHPSELSYRIGFNPLFRRIIGHQEIA